MHPLEQSREHDTDYSTSDLQLSEDQSMRMLRVMQRDTLSYNLNLSLQRYSNTWSKQRLC